MNDRFTLLQVIVIETVRSVRQKCSEDLSKPNIRESHLSCGFSLSSIPTSVLQQLHSNGRSHSLEVGENKDPACTDMPLAS
jgi:hypothetical protein